jgi:hypothetical protein
MIIQRLFLISFRLDILPEGQLRLRHQAGESVKVDTLFKVNQLMDDFDYFAAAGMA